MPSVSEISLAVIAAAFVIAVAALVPVLAQVRRTARRAEQVLAAAEGQLPGLLEQVRALVAKLDRTVDAMGDLTQTIGRLDQMAERSLETVEQIGTIMRQTARDVLAPSMAGAAGVLAALREGIQWVWPRRDRGRDDG